MGGEGRTMGGREEEKGGEREWEGRGKGESWGNSTLVVGGDRRPNYVLVLVELVAATILLVVGQLWWWWWWGLWYMLTTFLENVVTSGNSIAVREKSGN